MTSRAIDKTIIRCRFQVFHLLELVVYHPMHCGHLPRGKLRTLFITAKVLFGVTVGAIYTECTTETSVHDISQSGFVQPCVSAHQPTHGLQQFFQERRLNGRRIWSGRVVLNYLSCDGNTHIANINVWSSNQSGNLILIFLTE